MSVTDLPHRRLFIGLLPDAATQAAIAAHQARWHWAGRSRPICAPRLHLTLHFLGEVDVVREDALRRVLGAEQTPPFDLVLRTPQRWSGGVAVLRPDDSEVLRDLHDRLAARLVEADLAPPRGPWTPHVTLARGAFDCAPPDAVAPVLWTVDTFALVWSRLEPPARYEVIERYGRG